jgi:hypothetical protein
MSLAKTPRLPRITLNELARTRLQSGVSLYVRSRMVDNEFDSGPRWIKCEITHAFLDRLLQLRRACVELSLREVVVEACPAAWEEFDADVEIIAWEMRVTTHSVDLDGFPRRGDGHLTASLINFRDLCLALGQLNNRGAEPIEGLATRYAWLGGAIFTSTHDLDSFLELAKESFPELEALDNEASMAGYIHHLVPPTLAATPPACAAPLQ